MPQLVVLVIKKGKESTRPKQSKTEVPFFMDFSTSSTTDEGAPHRGREGKEEGKEKTGLPHASAVSPVLIFDEHRKRLPRLLRRKGEESGSKLDHRWRILKEGEAYL